MNTCNLAILAAALSLFMGCSKSTAKKAGEKSEPAAAEAAPRRNAAESLGIAAESTEGYMRSTSAATPAAAPVAPEAKPDATGNEPPASPRNETARNDVSPAGIRRKLTAVDGRTVDAELLAKSGDAVKIRRAADAKEFTIPLERISEADRAFVRESELPPLAAR